MTSAIRNPVVMDASAVVAMYIEREEVGSWIEATMYHRNPIAPELMPFEAANV